MRTLSYASLCLLVLISGCFNVEVADGTVKCLSGSRPCPQGYVCGGSGYCYRAGHSPPAQDMSIQVATNDMTAADMECGNLQTDPHNCGACGHDCTMLPNVATAVGVTCASAHCAIAASACQPGFAHCSSNPDDGCEANLSQSAHCGSCSACPSAMPLCSGTVAMGYACTLNCSSSTPDQCGNACTDLQSDPNHCKTCGTVCSYPHATATCSQGNCVQGTCTTGYMHCSSDPNSGCETYVMGTDANNCGGCNVKCKVGQACSSGTCVENQVTCSSAGITCQQSGCYQAGRYSISLTGGIVVDLNNGRSLWTRATRTATGHNNAVSDCASLALEGINGWRLPEWSEVLDLEYMNGLQQGCPTCNPAIDQSAFPDTASHLSQVTQKCYWSSTLYQSGYDCADYCSGENNNQDPGTGTGIYRCIHDPGP